VILADIIPDNFDRDDFKVEPEGLLPSAEPSIDDLAGADILIWRFNKVPRDQIVTVSYRISGTSDDCRPSDANRFVGVMDAREFESFEQVVKDDLKDGVIGDTLEF